MKSSTVAITVKRTLQNLHLRLISAILVPENITMEMFIKGRGHAQIEMKIHRKSYQKLLKYLSSTSIHQMRILREVHPSKDEPKKCKESKSKRWIRSQLWWKPKFNTNIMSPSPLPFLIKQSACQKLQVANPIQVSQANQDWISLTLAPLLEGKQRKNSGSSFLTIQTARPQSSVRLFHLNLLCVDLKAIISNNDSGVESSAEEESSSILLPVVRSNLDSSSLRSLTDMSSEESDPCTLEEYSCSDEQPLEEESFSSSGISTTESTPREGVKQT